MPTLEEKVSEALAKLGIRPRHSARPDDDEDDGELSAAVNAELLARAQESEKAAADLKAENEKLTAQLATQQEAERQASLAAHRESVERWGQEMRAAFKLTPAAAEKAEALAIEHPAVFAALRDVFATNPAIQALSGGKPGEDLREDGGQDGDTNRLHNLSLAYAKEHKVSYGVAMARVSAEHPELAAAVAAPRSVAVSDEE